MADQLANFLRNKKQQALSQRIDWKARKEVWLQNVSNLYETIHLILRDAIAAEDIAVRTLEMQLTEDEVGTYSVPYLEIAVGNERVELRPKGMMIFGAEARVDICGERDSVTLLKEDLLDPNAVWQVVTQRVPSLRVVPLDRDSLQYAFERVMLPLS